MDSFQNGLEQRDDRSYPLDEPAIEFSTYYVTLITQKSNTEISKFCNLFSLVNKERKRHDENNSFYIMSLHRVPSFYQLKRADRTYRKVEK